MGLTLIIVDKKLVSVMGSRQSIADKKHTGVGWGECLWALGRNC